MIERCFAANQVRIAAPDGPAAAIRGSELEPWLLSGHGRKSLLRDCILSNSHRRIQLRELCDASGLSRRRVEYLFMDLLGVRASAFLLRMRLQGVRRELLSAEPRHGMVKQHALNWGFRHLGRFAADYQMLFGERPSESLGRRRSSPLDRAGGEGPGRSAQDQPASRCAVDPRPLQAKPNPNSPRTMIPQSPMMA